VYSIVKSWRKKGKVLVLGMNGSLCAWASILYNVMPSGPTRDESSIKVIFSLSFIVFKAYFSLPTFSFLSPAVGNRAV